MQDPVTGELLPIPGDDPKNAPEGWEVYEVGGRVKFKGWWWEITAIYDGQLTVRPTRRSGFDQMKRGKRRKRRE